MTGDGSGGRLPKLYGSDSTSPQFKSKPDEIKRLINDALFMIETFGVPINDTPRRVECMGMALLAVANVRSRETWGQAEDLNSGRAVSTRQIIEWWNENLGESVSSGSYDDVRRKDLRLLVAADVVLNSHPKSARNSPSRGYGLNPEFAEAVRLFGSDEFDLRAVTLMEGRETLAAKLAAERQMERMPIRISEGVELSFGPGEHNQLIKACIEAFLPRFGRNAEVLYVGDAEDKDLHYDRAKLDSIGFFSLDHGELPDVVAYSEDENWVFLIEAVHSSGPVDTLRRAALKQLLHECTAEPIFVTAFLGRPTFRRFLPDIAWETEVWIAEEPDHLIHFNGHRFLGPYPDSQ